MSERYWIMGTQLGLLQELEHEARKALIGKVIDKQFIGNYYTDKEQRGFIKAMKKLGKAK